MGRAEYIVIANDAGWAIAHDGKVEGDYATKEAAFEAAVATASLAIREGYEVHLAVPGRDAGNRTNLGAPE